MYYRDVLPEIYIEEYIEWHRSLSSCLNAMLFHISFLKKMREVGKNNLDIPINSVHSLLFRNQFALLIVDTRNIVFDTGRGAITLGKFRNKLHSKVKTEFREEYIARIKKSLWDSDEQKSLRERVKHDINEFRKSRIAHNLYEPDLDVNVNLLDIENIFTAACDLFLAMNFGPNDFYSNSEVSGFDFSRDSHALFAKESVALEQQLSEFFRPHIVYSECVSKISYELNKDYQDSDIARVIEQEFAEINKSKV